MAAMLQHESSKSAWYNIPCPVLCTLIDRSIGWRVTHRGERFGLLLLLRMIVRRLLPLSYFAGDASEKAPSRALTPIPPPGPHNQPDRRRQPQARAFPRPAAPAAPAARAWGQPSQVSSEEERGSNAHTHRLTTSAQRRSSSSTTSSWRAEGGGGKGVTAPDQLQVRVLPRRFGFDGGTPRTPRIRRPA
jgi:hypothetical protein